MVDYINQIKKIISKEIKLNIDTISIEVPPNQELGDYAFPCFTLSKHIKKAPTEISKELESKIKLTKDFHKVKAIGPYLNFFVNKSSLAKEVLTKINKQKSKYGNFSKRNYVTLIESPGPNTNKPLHLGHVRNMLLGNALVNLNKAYGNKTFRVDIINNRGIHICKSMLAYKLFGQHKQPNKKSDHFVGDYYVLYAKKEAENKLLEKELSELLIKWEKGDKETISLWKKMNKWALDGFKQTYSRFGTKIDRTYYESDHYQKGKEVILKGLKNKIFEKDENNNIIINLEKEGLGKKVVLRADGTSIYITQDIALADLRYKDYKMNEMIYVVGSEQIHHFKSLFSILNKLDYKFSESCYHLAYGMVYLPEGKMKSREGTVVDADNLIDEIKRQASQEIKKRNKKISPKELDKLSEQIAMAAIKFYILKYDTSKDFTYDPKESISFEGETGPYIQYTSVRINSIIKKSINQSSITPDFNLLTDKSEEKLISLLSNYQNVIEKSVLEKKPSLLCRYLIDLSKAFNEFYHKCPVLGHKNHKLTSSRLYLIKSVKQVLENGLNLLGIEVPNRM